MDSLTKPRLADIDAWGMTHTGRLRSENQDHFFVGSLARGVVVDASSLGNETAALAEPERVASLAVVADGVGGVRRGAEAARLAVKALVDEVCRSFHQAAHSEAGESEVFTRLLHDSALACHDSLVDMATREDQGRLATTLTLFLGLWPHAYLLQVGDSRCYVFMDGRLSQVTRDQTVAQELVERGALSRTAADSSRWANVLSSSIGGPQATPAVTRIVRDWGAVILLCSDGLTKHVSDERIHQRLATMESARQVCGDLVQDALDGGGTDNITVVVGRTVRRDA